MTGKRTPMTNTAQPARGQHRQSHREVKGNEGLSSSSQSFILFIFISHYINHLLLLSPTPDVGSSSGLRLVRPMITGNERSVELENSY